MPHQPNIRVTAGIRLTSGSGRKRKAEFVQAGCLHKRTGRVPDHTEKGVRHTGPESEIFFEILKNCSIKKCKLLNFLHITI